MTERATADEPDSGVRQVHGRSLVRRMRGGAQAAMVLTDDGWYVVKWKQNAQHRRVLINEVIASELLHRLGIATPAWAMVHVDRDFLRANPEASVGLNRTSVRVRTGWHFGSKVPVNPEKRGIYDFLPASLMTRITNFDDFVRVFAFDLWVDNSDGRQAIFFSVAGRNFSAQMIDNGYAFGFTGFEWRMRDRLIGKECRSLPRSYLSQPPAGLFDAVTADIQTRASNGFEGIRRCIRCCSQSLSRAWTTAPITSMQGWSREYAVRHRDWPLVTWNEESIGSEPMSRSRGYGSRSHTRTP